MRYYSGYSYRRGYSGCNVFESEGLDPKTLALDIIHRDIPTKVKEVVIRSEDGKVGGKYRVEIGVLSVVEIKKGKDMGKLEIPKVKLEPHLQPVGKRREGNRNTEKTS